MFEKTLWQIFEIEDNKQLEDELVLYYKEIESLFKDADYNSGLILPLTTELLPSDPKQLEKIKTRMETLLYPDDREKIGYTTGVGAYAFTALASAAANKLEIYAGTNNAESILHSIETLKASIIETKKIIAANAENKSAVKFDEISGMTFEDLLAFNQKELKLLNVSLELMQKLPNTSDSTQLDRFTIVMASFDRIMHFIPEEEQFDISNDLHKMNLDLQKMQIYNSVQTHQHKNIQALHADLKSSLLDMNRIILKLVNSLHRELFTIRNQISQNLFVKLNKDLVALGNFGATLSAAVGIKAYQTLVDNFGLKFAELSKQIKKAPILPQEIFHRQGEEKATRAADSQFHTSMFPYQLNGRDLRNSKNEYYQDQLKVNFENVANPDKFIVMAADKNNLLQLKKDIERSLRINGKTVPEEIYNDDVKLKEFLTTELGKDNADNLIRHYDQTIPILISGSLTTSAGEGRAGGIDFNAGKHTESIYVDDGVMYREAAIDQIKIYAPNDPNTDDRWIFKVNVRILSAGSADGFAVTRIGTDSAMICNSILQKSTQADLKKMVDTIVLFESDLLKKENKFEKDLSAGKKLDLVELSLHEITQFKTGKITFDELTANIKTLSATPVEHLSVTGKAKGLFGGLPGVSTTLNKFADALEKVKKTMDDKAAKLNVLSSKNISPSPSPRSPRP